MGAVFYSQAVDNYLDEKMESRLVNLMINHIKMVVILVKNIAGMKHLDIGEPRLILYYLSPEQNYN